MVSELQAEINTLRSRVSGIRSYQDFLDARLNNNAGFGGYESELISRADGRSNVSEDDVTTARDAVDGPFASLSDLAGDPDQETGVFALTDYDQYRQYLIDNGVAAIDADKHNQTIQALFGSGDVFLDAALEFDNFDELESWLIDNGWTATEAQEFVDKLKNEFDSYADFLNRLNSDIETIEELLNELDHAASDPSGGPRVERRGSRLFLIGSQIRMVELGEDAISNPEPNGDVDWSIDTPSQSTPISEPFFVTASGTAPDGGSFETAVSLVVNGEVAEVKTVQVSDGEVTVQFERDFSLPGEYQIKVGNSSAITVTVELEV